MSLPRSVYRVLALCFAGLSFLISVHAQIPLLQRKDSSKVSAAMKPDSLIGQRKDSASSRLQMIIADTSMPALLIRLEAATLMANEHISILRRGFDTLEISQELPVMEKIVRSAAEDLESDSYSLNMRNLYSTRVTLRQVETQVKGYQEILKAYSQTLNEIDKDIENTRQDPYFRNIPEDPELRRNYVSQLLPIIEKMRVVDSLRKLQLKKLSLLQNRATLLAIDCSDKLDLIHFTLGNYKQRIYRRDNQAIWNFKEIPSTKPLGTIVKEGFQENGQRISFFLGSAWPRIFLLLFLAIGFYGLIVYGLNRLVTILNGQTGAGLHFIRRSALLSSALLFLTVLPFVLTNPPTGFVQVIWLLTLFTATLLRYEDWPEPFQKLWPVVLILFCLFSFDSFLIENHPVERLFMILLNIAAISLGMRLNRVVLRDKTRYHPLMDESILLFLGLNILALLLNLSGRFILSKIISNSSIMSIVILLALQLVREIVMEFLFLVMETNKKSRILSSVDYEQLRKNFRNVFNVLTIVLWLMVFAWSMNFLDLVFEKMGEFLSRERHLGEFSFSLSSILIFVAVVWLSMFISRIVTLLTQTHSTPDDSKGAQGSWVLLVRLGIISAGFLLAVAAAGIPMDKLAIVLGALSVGIGFGLQNIVSNLISGIILAFEKPIVAGDIIELGNRSGTIQEIGIRSSRIATLDGATIIVPNGDFISQQVINWTHNNNRRRRIELNVGVQYGTDLQQVKDCIQQVIEKNVEIASYPEPAVLIRQFGASSVDFQVFVWTSQFGQWATLRSSLYQGIYDAFAKQGIEIPFPQTDIHIRSINRQQEEKQEGAEIRQEAPRSSDTSS